MMGVLGSIRESIGESIGAAQIAVVDYGVLNDDRVRLDSWLADGCHDSLTYMEQHRREDPRTVLPHCQSLIVCLFSPQKWGYHTPIRKSLKQLLKELQELDSTIEGRGVVDSAPIMEKAWGARAGLGWIGRNSLLIHPELGSDFNIGIMLTNRTTAELSALSEEFKGYANRALIADGCDSCDSICSENCPSGAIRGDRMINCTICLSHLSQKRDSVHAHALAQDNAPTLTIGCTICQKVCPYNAHRFGN